LPWSTSNQDLVELFTTIGKVDRAEIGYEQSGRSKGIGVIQFDAEETAESAIQKFQSYVYGGRYRVLHDRQLILDLSDCPLLNMRLKSAII
jgi:RNA recognition motif-containing protein